MLQSIQDKTWLLKKEKLKFILMEKLFCLVIVEHALLYAHLKLYIKTLFSL